MTAIHRAARNQLSDQEVAQPWVIQHLGGAGGGSVTSDSSVYTKNLGGKSFVNPFGN